MGVTGLWSLLEPAGKPVPLESLENQIIAVDVSIWLNQSLHGFRDASGAAVPNAHLLGLFHRICKLLFYRIRPVFVFDGAPPQLKKDTLFKRRQRKGAAERKSEASRAKIIENYLRAQVVSKKLERQTQQVDTVLKKGQGGLAALLNKRTKEVEKDIFELPEIKNEDEDVFSSDDDRDDLMAEMDLAPSTDIHAFDTESDRFTALSKQKQYEVLLELRDRRKQNSWAKVHEMPKKADDFSGFQLERCLKRRNIQRRMDDVGNTLNEGETDAALKDHKLFVGDRDGVRQQRAKRRKIIAGKDFLYMDGLKAAKAASMEGVAGSSKDVLNEDEDDPEGVSQEELMAMIEGRSVKGVQLGDSEDDILEVTEVSVMKSSRQGGVPLIKIEDDDDFPVPGPSCAQVVPVEIKDEPEDVVEQEEEDKGNVEIHLDFNKEQPPEDDLFADVFEQKDAPLNLRELLAKEFIKEPEERKSDTGEEIMSSSSSDEDDSQAEKPKGDVAIIDEALNYDRTEEIFAHIAKRSRQEPNIKDVYVDDPKPKSAQKEAHELAEKMKRSDHLLLKITSKYLEEQSQEQSSPKGEKEKEPKKSDFALSLENETELLLAEMRSKQRESKLLEIKNRAVNSGSAMASKTSSATTSRSEDALLSTLKAKAVDADQYTSAVLADDGFDINRGEKEKETIYGASAPGFVRSRQFDVVETSNEVELDESIAFKLETAESTDDNMLTVNELRSIQDKLARDQNQLVAERGKQQRMAATLSDQMYAECQELLQLFGLPWIVAPSEAEAQCAFLDMNDLCQGTITEDSDVWVFGGQTVFKNFFNQDKHCERFSAGEIAKHLGLGREKMILLAHMTGSDYTVGIDDVGPVTAMEVMSEFTGNGLEPLKKFKEWWDLHSKDLTLPPENKVREHFRRLEVPDNFPSLAVHEAYINPRINNSTEMFSWAVPNFVEIRDFAQDKLGWPKAKIDEVMKPVIKTFSSKISQSRIDNYFRPDRITLPMKGNFQASKRVQAAIAKAKGRAAGLEACKQSKNIMESAKNKIANASTSKQSVAEEPARVTGKTAKELEEGRKQDAKMKAIELFKKANAKQGGGGRKKRQERSNKRQIVLAQHNLSESDSD